MAMKLSPFVKKNLTDDQITYAMAGERKAKELTTMVQEALGVAKHIQVEAKRQVIIEGPPGVGKSYTAKAACVAAGIQPLTVGTGTTLSVVAAMFAYAEYWTPKKKEIVCIFDDADDVVFNEKKNINTWKRVFTDEEDEPVFNHNVNLGNQIRTWENDPSKKAMVTAVKHFMPVDSLGITVPLTRFRFIFLTNFDYEKIAEKKTWLEPVIDRFNYNRLQYEWTTAWGWLTNVLLTTQPFKEKYGIELSEQQKVEIIRWIYDKWDKMGKKQTYRTVREMAQYIINEPNNYLNRWQKFIRK